ncbi:MAG: hypothetical protein KatS3mg118_2245 [Paracoccaceae bacterium]|nr:MAG: hypothetical protein KatS3mg118_2245 [Paracoccaceae bacterium]
MLDIGWSELLVIGVVALIVVGPKDLPAMFRTVGQYVGKARSMAREFQRSMDEAARQAELDEVRKAAQSVQEVGRIAAGGIGGACRVGAERLATRRRHAGGTGRDRLPGGVPCGGTGRPAGGGSRAPGGDRSRGAGAGPGAGHGRQKLGRQGPGAA